MTQALGYIRVSSGGQVVSGYGLDVQRERVQEYARAMNLELVTVHADEGTTGVVTERAGLLRLINDLTSTGARHVIVPALDRLARKLTAQEAILARLWEHGAVVHTVDGGIVEQDDADDPMRTAMRQMRGIFAELDRSLVVARLRAGREAKRASGGYHCGAPPYGWKAHEGALVEHPNEQVVVVRILKELAADAAPNQVAEALNRDGIVSKRGGRWHGITVRRVAEYHAPR